MEIDTLPHCLKLVARTWARETPHTVTAQKLVLKEAGIRPKDITQQLAHVLEAAAEIAKLIKGNQFDAQERRLLRSIRHSGIPRQNAIGLRGKRLGTDKRKQVTVQLEATPQGRLNQARTEAARKYIGVLRTGVNDLTDFTYTLDPAEIGLTVVDETDKDKYKKKVRLQMRTWVCHYHHNMIVLPAYWRTRVEGKKLAALDNTFTVDASPITAPAGVELYSATWIAIAICNRWREHRGYIARQGSITAHGESVTAALQLLAERTGHPQLPQEWENTVKAGPATEWGKQHKELLLHLSSVCMDRKEAYELKSWCHAVGLAYEQQLPCDKLMNAYVREPRIEARAAIIQSYRKMQQGGSRVAQ